MGCRVKWLAILLILTATGSFAEAQVLPLSLPWNMKVDSSVRLEYLFGTQILKDISLRVPSSLQSISNTEAAFDLFRVEYGPRLPVVEGFVELTSGTENMSARFGGWASFLEPRLVLDRTVGYLQPVPTSLADANWNIKPEFWGWEAAGLYHVFQGLGHRFSLTAGYRREQWNYRGELSSDSNAISTHNFSSHIPFIGLQSSMLFPLWKARFEILGSPIVVQNVTHELRDGNVFVDYRGQATGTGLIELRMEGTVHLSPAYWFGGFFRYSYQEMYGTATGRRSQSSDTSFDRKMYIGQSFATIGFNATILF